jgi:hypothetical protein
MVGKIVVMKVPVRSIAKNCLLAIGCGLTIVVFVVVGLSLSTYLLFPGDTRRTVSRSDCIVSAVILMAVACSLRYFRVFSTLQMILALCVIELLIVGIILFQAGFSARDILSDPSAFGFVWGWYIDVQGLYLIGSWLLGIGLGANLAKLNAANTSPASRI